MTSTKLCCQAVFVKTRVWAGYLVSRAHKTWSRSFLCKDFQSQARSENGLFLFCIFELVQLIVLRIWKVVNFIPWLSYIRKYSISLWIRWVSVAWYSLHAVLPKPTFHIFNINKLYMVFKNRFFFSYFWQYLKLSNIRHWSKWGCLHQLYCCQDAEVGTLSSLHCYEKGICYCVCFKSWIVRSLFKVSDDALNNRQKTVWKCSLPRFSEKGTSITFAFRQSLSRIIKQF